MWSTLTNMSRSPRGPREVLELLDGRAAREQRPEAREEVPGGARDGGGVAAGGLEDLLPAQRLGAEHVEPGGEGPGADGGGPLGGVGDGADHGHELAQAAAALVDAGARGPPGLEERDELPQELRLHDLHPRARDQHRSSGVCSSRSPPALFSLEKMGEEQELQKQARFEEAWWLRGGAQSRR